MRRSLLPSSLPVDALARGTAAALALALMASGLVLSQGEWDHRAFALVNRWGHEVAHTASALSVLGLGAAMFVLACAIGLRHPLVPAALLLTLLGGGLAVQLMKSLLALPRPAAVLDPQHLVVIGTALKGRAMPSGHAALFWAVATLVWLLPPAAGPRPARWGLALAVSGLAVAGALARVAVGAHWPSDLMAGAALGVLTGLLIGGTPRGVRAVQAMAAAMRGRAGSRVMVALVVATSAVLWVAERDLPLAQAWHGGLAAFGLATAVGWWRLHPGPGARGLARRPAL